MHPATLTQRVTEGISREKNTRENAIEVLIVISQEQLFTVSWFQSLRVEVVLAILSTAMPVLVCLVTLMFARKLYRLFAGHLTDD